MNRATKAELDQLYGIGPAKAKAIIAARPYRSVDELTKAYGIGEKTLEKIRPYIKVGISPSSANESSSSGKININTASQAELESLPGIGEVIARRIINARPFSYKAQLKSIKGIGDKRYEGIKDKINL